MFIFVFQDWYFLFPHLFWPPKHSPLLRKASRSYPIPFFQIVCKMTSCRCVFAWPDYAKKNNCILLCALWILSYFVFKVWTVFCCYNYIWFSDRVAVFILSLSLSALRNLTSLFWIFCTARRSVFTRSWPLTLTLPRSCKPYLIVEVNRLYTTFNNAFLLKALLSSSIGHTRVLELILTIFVLTREV